ncbi:carbon-nitrogen hydrolase family protein [Anaerolineales bacterium HSG24]|nr:carbon-nitrogen hydrolase family protein [Anaerolineales bacterium HSG24]
MSRKINIAAIQMDANPASISDRLQRAERLVVQAVQTGAQLVVLPEIFNTGYGYTDENFYRAEPITGQTVTWLKEMAIQHHIHLAGSLMLLDEPEIYNALLLFAPDGRMWRYDKNYPWGWERGYFRGKKGITVAKTELGDIGLMICWDVAHPHLWRQYAGQIDLMIVSSCPPDVTNPTFVFPKGKQVTFDDFGKVGTSLKGSGRLLFGEMVNQQTAWLGVPAIQTVGTGHIRTAIPSGLLSLLSYIPVAPKLVKHLPQANNMQLKCGFVQGCKIVDGWGEVQTELEQVQGETYTIAEVTIPDKKPRPNSPQPKSLLPKIAYFSSDILLPLLMLPVYHRGRYQVFGKKTTPRPYIWRFVTIISIFLFCLWLTAYFRGHQKSAQQ